MRSRIILAAAISCGLAVSGCSGSNSSPPQVDAVLDTFEDLGPQSKRDVCAGDSALFFDEVLERYPDEFLDYDISSAIDFFNAGENALGLATDEGQYYTELGVESATGTEVDELYEKWSKRGYTGEELEAKVLGDLEKAGLTSKDADAMKKEAIEELEDKPGFLGYIDPINSEELCEGA